jgi:hypothetical protein
MAKSLLYRRIVIAISIGVFSIGTRMLIAEELSPPPIVRVEGNEVGIPWFDLASVLRPSLALSGLSLTASDWVIPWQAFQFAASDTSARYHEAIKVIHDSSGKPRALQIDVESLSKNANQWKQEFAEWRASENGKPAYRLEPIPNLREDSQKSYQRIMVIAGYQSQQNEALSVAQHLYDRTSLPTEILSYPSDGAISVSAQKLADLLRTRVQESPQTEWTIVGHSMGSVIGRAAIELHQAKGVKKLIQIFPPNHGSVLAEIAEPLDGIMIAKSQLTRILAAFDGGSNEAIGKALAPAAMLTWMSQGFGLASRDLCPDSEFLRSLNSCRRCNSVDYSVVVGTGGPLHPLVGATILLSGPAVEEQLANQKDLAEVRLAWKWIERILNDGQLIQGRGDGVVSTNSAQLSGVTDTIILSCNHLAWSDLKSEEGQRVMMEVLKRIKTDR